jgi:hypothetical protein
VLDVTIVRSNVFILRTQNVASLSILHEGSISLDIDGFHVHGVGPSHLCPVVTSTSEKAILSWGACLPSNGLAPLGSMGRFFEVAPYSIAAATDAHVVEAVFMSNLLFAMAHSYSPVSLGIKSTHRGNVVLVGWNLSIWNDLFGSEGWSISLVDFFPLFFTALPLKKARSLRSMKRAPASY